MNITVSKKELFTKLKLAGKIIQPSKVNPELDNFLFQVNDEGLSIIGSDDQGRITTSIDCKIDNIDIRQFTTNAKMLIDAVKEIPEQPLIFTISAKDARVNISCQYSNGRFDIVGGIGDLYPTINPTGDISEFKVSSGKIAIGLKRTYFRASDNELRPVMTGVYVECLSGKLSFVATDGSTMAIMEYEESINDRHSFILPTKIAKTLVDIIPDDDVEFVVVTSSHHVEFKFSDISIIYRMIDGRYPNYRSVIPTENNLVCTANRSDVIAALKRVSIFCSKTSSIVKVTLSNNLMQLAAQDLDYSTSADENVPVSYSDKQICIGLNAIFLLDIMQNLPCEEFCLCLSDPSRAATITYIDEANGESLLYLIMPLMINF